ncbi:MAG TPA: hypothetical protein VJM80_06335, partial [bacterium]|nr:hypothetical protein [bacterium]
EARQDQGDGIFLPKNAKLCLKFFEIEGTEPVQGRNITALEEVVHGLFTSRQVEVRFNVEP